MSVRGHLSAGLEGSTRGTGEPLSWGGMKHAFLLPGWLKTRSSGLLRPRGLGCGRPFP